VACDAPLTSETDLDVSDALGRLVFHATLPKETPHYKLLLQNLSAGVFIATLHNDTELSGSWLSAKVSRCSAP
jgi:hypothetical protein